MGRRTAARPGSDQGQRRILDAAREAFATYGFEGASLRAISQEAGVLHTAMLYHYNTKEDLWCAVMAELCEELEGRIAACTQEMQGASPDALARRVVREFVHFCADRPELHRIMTIEGRSETTRLAWLVDTYTNRMFKGVAAMARAADIPNSTDPVRLFYAIIGLAASTFTLAPEFRRLSGRDPFKPKEIEATAALVERLIFGNETQKGRKARSQ